MISHMRSYILIIVVIFLGGVSGWYADHTSFTTVHDHGVTFKYPKKLFVQKVPSTLNIYSNYQLKLSDNSPAGVSEIMVSIPLKSFVGDSSLSHSLLGQTTNPKVIPSSLHGHTGEMVSYRTKPIEGDIFIPATVIDETFISNINNSPIMLSYFKADGAASLDDAWQEVKGSIKW